MRRFLVVDYLGIPKGLKVYAKSKEEVQKKYPKYKVEEVDDSECVKYIGLICSYSIPLYSDNIRGDKVEEFYRFGVSEADHIVFLLEHDFIDADYYDFVSYIRCYVKDGVRTYDKFLTVTSPKEFYERFISIKDSQANKPYYHFNGGN